MGCAITPQPIFGSDMKAGQTAPGAAWGTSYGPSHAHIVGSDGAVHEISGNGDSVLGEAPVHPGLIMLETRRLGMPWYTTTGPASSGPPMWAAC
jgi:hypothetical protein